jgi:hypothetical protein
MIRTAPAGDLGLEVLLGGGFRLVVRLPERPEKASASILVRGGAGAGKTLFGLHAAIELARALGGDVAVAGVEILPSEYLAQVLSARSDIDPSRIVMLPGSAPSMDAPRVYCGLLADLDPEAPDLVAGLEALGRDVVASGGKPVVFVVDSLTDGYGLGASIPRASADAVMKFAAQGGHGLVLCEETAGGGASPWVFAADTVVELGVEPRPRGRWIEVRKHRFGASVSGRHEIELGAGAPPAVFPEPHAWVAHDLREVLSRYGWQYQDRVGMPVLLWEEPPQPNIPLSGAFVVITGYVAGVARSLAYALRPAAAAWHGAGGETAVLLVELDPLLVHGEVERHDSHRVCYLPTVHGPARALRLLVEQFSATFAAGRPEVARGIVGDLAAILGVPDEIAWIDALRVFASLMIASRWGIPVVAYRSSPEDPSARASALLSSHADLIITAPYLARAVAVQRWGREARRLDWTRDVTTVPLAIDRLLRPPGRAPA